MQMIITEHENCLSCESKLINENALETRVGYCLKCQENGDVVLEQKESFFEETFEKEPTKKTSGFVKTIIIVFILVIYFMLAGAAGYKNGGGFIPMFCLLTLIAAIRKM